MMERWKLCDQIFKTEYGQLEVVQLNMDQNTPHGTEHSQSLEVELTNSKDIEFAWELLDYDHTNVEACLALKVDFNTFSQTDIRDLF